MTTRQENSFPVDSTRCAVGMGRQAGPGVRRAGHAQAAVQDGHPAGYGQSQANHCVTGARLRGCLDRQYCRGRRTVSGRTRRTARRTRDCSPLDRHAVDRRYVLDSRAWPAGRLRVVSGARWTSPIWAGRARSATPDRGLAPRSRRTSRAPAVGLCLGHAASSDCVAGAEWPAGLSHRASLEPARAAVDYRPDDAGLAAPESHCRPTQSRRAIGCRVERRACRSPAGHAARVHG
jgi:hypothetical protein